MVYTIGFFSAAYAGGQMLRFNVSLHWGQMQALVDLNQLGSI